jgi:hypothetical protein
VITTIGGAEYNIKVRVTEAGFLTQILLLIVYPYAHVRHLLEEVEVEMHPSCFTH